MAANPESPYPYPIAIYLDLLEERYEPTERRLLELLAREPPVDVVTPSSFHPATTLAYVYLRTGRQGEGTRLLEALLANRLREVSTGAGYISHYDQVRICSMLGNLDEAIHWLDVAIARHWPFYHTPWGPFA